MPQRIGSAGVRQPLGTITKMIERLHILTVRLAADIRRCCAHHARAGPANGVRLTLCGLVIVIAARPVRSGPATMPSVDELLQAVRPFPSEMLSAAGDEKARRLMQGYYDSIRAWGEVAAQRFLPVPGRPGQGYYGDGGHEEDHIRPIG